MTPLRVMVFERSASIRALLKRGIGDTDGLTSIGSFPLSEFLGDRAALEEVEAVVIGLAREEEDLWPGLAAHVKRSQIPAVILSPPGESCLAPGLWPEQCLFLEKPRSPQGWESLCSTLVAALKGMKNRFAGADDRGPRRLESGLGLIAVGGSAGGPDATGEMLKTVGEALEHTSIVIVQHIGVDFVSGYVQWLRRILPWANVEIAQDGETVAPGRVRIAGSGTHLEISNGPVLRLDRESPPDHGHRPSVDSLFQSLARSHPEGSAGVLLSGMGIDGVEGLLSLHRAGSLTLVQDRASSAVFGMPRAALERGAATIAQPPAALGTVLKSYVESGRRR